MVRERFRRDLGDVILLQPPVKIFSLVAPFTRRWRWLSVVTLTPVDSSEQYSQFGCVFRQCGRDTGQTFFPTINNAVSTATRMWAETPSAAFHGSVLGETCRGNGNNSEIIFRVYMAIQWVGKVLLMNESSMGAC